MAFNEKRWSRNYEAARALRIALRDAFGYHLLCVARGETHPHHIQHLNDVADAYQHFAKACGYHPSPLTPYHPTSAQ